MTLKKGILSNKNEIYEIVNLNGILEYKTDENLLNKFSIFNLPYYF